MLFNSKTAQMERTCKLQERSAQYKPSFDKEVFAEGFNEMRVFLQPTRYVPVPGGAECMLCTITIARGSSLFEALGLGPENRKVILVGKAFMALSHVKKLILLRAERLRQVQSLTKDLTRPEGIASTTLDREIATRQALAWEFRPRLIERTLRSRDGVVGRSATKVSQGIYANSDDHYKPEKHPFGQGGRAYRCYVMEKTTFPFLDKLFNKIPVEESETVVRHEEPLTDEELQEEMARLSEF